MSKNFKCDTCGKVGETTNLASPKGWMSVTISGHVPRDDKRYGGHQSIKYDLCDECVNKVFPKEMDQKNLQAEFGEMAMELIQELVQECFDNAER